MIVKNYEIAKFGEYLLELKLKGKQSRMRTRFIRLMQGQLDLVNEERSNLLIDYAIKDEDGEPVKNKDENGEEFISLENGNEYNLEIQKLMTEDFIIEETAERLDMLREVRDTILNSEEEFSGVEAMQYDRWCEIVEDIE